MYVCECVCMRGVVIGVLVNNTTPIAITLLPVCLHSVSNAPSSSSSSSTSSLPKSPDLALTPSRVSKPSLSSSSLLESRESERSLSLKKSPDPPLTPSPPRRFVERISR